MFNGPGVNHRRAVKVHYPSRYLVHKCLDAQWLSAKFLHGIQQHRPEIAGRGAINQQIQAGKLRLAGVDDDGIRPSHRGLCDLAGGKGSRAQVNPTQFGHDVARMGARQGQPGMGILARQQVNARLSGWPGSFLLADPLLLSVETAKQQILAGRKSRDQAAIRLASCLVRHIRQLITMFVEKAGSMAAAHAKAGQRRYIHQCTMRRRGEVSVKACVVPTINGIAIQRLPSLGTGSVRLMKVIKRRTFGSERVFEGRHELHLLSTVVGIVER